MMNRVNGAQGVKLLECTNPVKDKWRVRWDVHDNEDGSADYMEAEFNGKPSEDTIKAMVSEWFNDRTNETILSGFVWNGMSVWLSTENQFNYKAAYDLAVQSDGKTLPVTFKFGTDDVPCYHTFTDIDELTDFYTKALQHIQDTLADGWKSKDNFNFGVIPRLRRIPSGEGYKKSPRPVKIVVSLTIEHKAPVIGTTGGVDPRSPMTGFFVCARCANSK